MTEWIINMKFEVKKIISGSTLFEADIACDESESYGVKLGLAIYWGYKNYKSFMHGDFDDAIFRNIHFHGTKFKYVTLKRAKFHDVHFNRVLFEGVNLDNALFKNSQFYNTAFYCTSLTGTMLDPESRQSLKDNLLSIMRPKDN